MSTGKEFLDKIGLKKLWKMIDSRKQNKLKAGDITTELLANKSVTASKIADGAVKSDNVDWATIRPTTVGTKILQSYGPYTETTTIQIPYDGFLNFTARVTGKGAARLQRAGVDEVLGGISYIDNIGDIQLDFSIPVRKGDNLTFFLSFSGSIMKASLREIVSGS